MNNDCKLMRRGKDVIFLYNGIEYKLTDHPYEPCLYINKDGRIFRTLHYAFTVDDLPEWFEKHKTIHAINGKDYDLEAFCRILAATIDGKRSEMDFPFAARLIQ